MSREAFITMELIGLSTSPRTSASKCFTRTICHVKLTSKLELIIEPIIQQLHKQNNNLNYAKKVVDDVDEQNLEQINACDKVSEDLKALRKNYNELVKELGELFVSI